MREPKDPPCEPAPEGLKGDRLLDTLGLFCPVPIVRTAETVRKMEAGDVLEVLSDDRVILLDMPA
ncbi:MAG TPA: sulfurtransferase TusA family protein, partial [Dongiaceae bacterium]|nr:sulfurtransferase TusA family protein [Dongiaceae bacterium]